MDRDAVDLLWMMTPIERQMYAAIGGSVPTLTGRIRPHWYRHTFDLASEEKRLANVRAHQKVRERQKRQRYVQRRRAA